MRNLLLVFSTLSFLLAGCTAENNREVEAEGIEEAEVKEVKSGELDLDFGIKVLENQTIFYISLSNNSGELKKLEFPSSQKYEIIVKNHKQEEVFRYSKGKMFTQAIETSIIKSGEKMQWEEVWDYSHLPPGKYKAEVTILAHHTEDLHKGKSFYIKKE